MSDSVVAEFIIGQRPEIEAEYYIEQERPIDTIFTVKADVDIKGSDLIGVSKLGNKVTITSKTFTFEQGIASDEWVIEHNLNKYPSVSLVDSAGTQFEAAVEYIDENNIIIRMNGATTGKAYLN